jgi:hypothetical protein
MAIAIIGNLKLINKNMEKTETLCTYNTDKLDKANSAFASGKYDVAAKLYAEAANDNIIKRKYIQHTASEKFYKKAKEIMDITDECDTNVQ